MKKEKLHNINSNGFKTPDNYFQSFEDKLFERLNEKETNEGVNDSGFTIPKDYFESLDGKILNKIKEKPVIKLNTRKVFYYVTGIAASLLLMVSIFMNGDDKTQELSAEMVETYFKNSDLDSYELAELLVNADILEEDFTLIETECYLYYFLLS